MPCEVMRALRENDGTSLVIRWNDSEEIVIPAGKAQPAESQRINYPLSLLAKPRNWPEKCEENASVFQPESQMSTSGETVLLIAILVVFVASAAGYVWHRNRKTNE